MDGAQAQLTLGELRNFNGLNPGNDYVISECMGGWALQQILGSMLGQDFDPADLALLEAAVIEDPDMASDCLENGPEARAA